MNILSYDEIIRVFMIGLQGAAAIIVGFFFAVYKNRQYLDELKQILKDQSEAIKVLRIGRNHQSDGNNGSDKGGISGEFYHDDSGPVRIRNGDLPLQDGSEDPGKTN